MVSMILTPPWPIALAELLSTTHSCLSIQPSTKHGEHDSHPALANRPRRVTLYNTPMQVFILTNITVSLLIANQGILQWKMSWLFNKNTNIKVTSSLLSVIFPVCALRSLCFVDCFRKTADMAKTMLFAVNNITSSQQYFLAEDTDFSVSEVLCTWDYQTKQQRNTSNTWNLFDIWLMLVFLCLSCGIKIFLI